MPKKKKVSILDVTIRDGSYAIDYRYSPRQVAAVARALGEAGIDYMEANHGCGLGAVENLGMTAAASDIEYVRAAKGTSGKTKVGVIASRPPATRRKDIDAVIGDVDFIRFAANCDDPGAVEESIAYARKIKPDLEIFMQIMRSTRRPKKDLVAAGRRAESMGVDIAYLVDTTGHFLPEETADIVSAMVSKLKIGVGFHGHDNLRMALANSIAAIEAGATSVDASLRGMGRGAGNAQLECLVSLMKRKGLAGGVDLDRLVEAGEKLIAPVMPHGRGVSSIDVISAEANIDIYPVDLYEKIAEAAGIELSEIIKALGKNPQTVEVGPEDIRIALKKLKANPERTFAAAGLAHLNEGKETKEKKR